mmetsp:Transcript_107515/g.346940  ORF Transcript_107515/g.346940 Transcript_107515/m.346940 type:complete len:343 (-) Transcript_107515:99-1127(-)
MGGGSGAMQPNNHLCRLPMQVQVSLLRWCGARDLCTLERSCQHFHDTQPETGEGLSLPSSVAKMGCCELRWPRMLVAPAREADAPLGGPGADWHWYDWKAEYLLATTTPEAGVRLPDGSECLVQECEQEGQRRAAEAARELPRDRHGNFAIGASNCSHAVLIALQARDLDLLEAALRCGDGEPSRSACVAGVEPLWLAIDQQPPNLPAIRALLRHGVDPDRHSESGVSPLHFAIYGGLDACGGTCNPQLARALTVRALLAGGADPMVRCKPYDLWLAGNDCEDAEMVSALAAALGQGNWSAVAALAAAGAVPSAAELQSMDQRLVRLLGLGGPRGRPEAPGR